MGAKNPTKLVCTENCMNFVYKWTLTGHDEWQHARRLSTVEGYRGYGAEQGNKVLWSLFWPLLCSIPDIFLSCSSFVCQVAESFCWSSIQLFFLYLYAQNKSFSLVWVYLSLLGCPSSEACEIITFLFLKFDVSSFLILFTYTLAGWRGLHVYEHNIMQILAVVNFFVYVAGT